MVYGDEVMKLRDFDLNPDVGCQILRFIYVKISINHLGIFRRFGLRKL